MFSIKSYPFKKTNPMNKSAKAFWNWFEANHQPYLFFNQVDPTEKARLTSLLLAELHKYCDQLCFEVDNHSEGPQELTISACGRKENFPLVEAFVAQAPKLKHWAFGAFRKRQEQNIWVRFDGIVFKTEDIWIIPYEYPADLRLIGMRVCLKNYEAVKDVEDIMQGIYAILDLMLGEHSFALDIDYVEIGPVPEGDPEEEGMIEITRLPQYIEDRKKRYPRNN